MEPFGKTKKTQCEEWVKRDNAVIAPCQHIPFYDLVVDEAKGDILVDLDNNHYVDFLSSASSLNIGSRRPEIVQAITEQMNKCIQFSPVYSYNVPMIEYAEELVKLFPQKEPGETIMLSYSNCGSEANDAAIKFCRGATKRSKIIAFTNSYHGNTYGSSTLSACTEKMHEGIGPLLPDVYHFPFYGIDVPDDECERDCLREIETAFRTYLPANEVAAVIIEPMQGDGGMLPAHHIFMRKLSSLCRENGILFIAEEVQLAFWRTGKCFSIWRTTHIRTASSWENRRAEGWFLALSWPANRLSEVWSRPLIFSRWQEIISPVRPGWRRCAICKGTDIRRQWKETARRWCA